VLLLDEIEKAHPDIFNILLQVMDHATLTDAQGRKADFRHVILIMTTNAGAQEMAAVAIGFGEVSNLEKGQKALEKLFSPEFRNRLDAVVHFGSLSAEAVERVVDKFITELEGQLAQRRVHIELSAAARRWLAERGYDKTFGARPMARLIQDRVKRVLADEMLFGQLKDGGRVEIDAAGDDLTFAYAPLPPSKLKRRQEETEPA
jgi:ATP-dependent Clp protease ATP-binding subunit ClpA